MRILLGVGGSEHSRRALEETVERVRETGDELTVAIFSSEEVKRSVTDVESEVREILDEAGIEAELRRVGDHPGSKLVEIADEEFDRLVIGGGSRSPLGKIQLGTVAEFAVLNAETPVTLIR